jgi:hypothetical protein
LEGLCLILIKTLHFNPKEKVIDNENDEMNANENYAIGVCLREEEQRRRV